MTIEEKLDEILDGYEVSEYGIPDMGDLRLTKEKLRQAILALIESEVSTIRRI